MIATVLAVLLTIIATWDGDHNGQVEGVGAGRQVQVYKGGYAYAAGYTDSQSQATFEVEPGTGYAVNVRVPSTRLFFVWSCQETFDVGNEDEFVHVECVEKFFLFIPWGKR